MKYSQQILKNKNLFKRLKYSSSNALNIKYSWTLSYNYRRVFGFLTSKKRYAQKKSACGTVMQHSRQPIQNECRISISEKVSLFEILLPDDVGSISET